MKTLFSGLRNGLTTIFGAIPGAAVALGELFDLLDGDESTVFELKVFALAASAAVAFLFSRDANKTSESCGAR